MTTNPDIPVKSGIGETVFVSDSGGFKGYTANFQYFNYNIHIQKIRAILEDGPLVMNWSNPLYYLYIGYEYLTAFNVFILTMFLPDPTKYAQELYKLLKTPKLSELPVECRVQSSS